MTLSEGLDLVALPASVSVIVRVVESSGSVRDSFLLPTLLRDMLVLMDDVQGGKLTEFVVVNRRL